MDNYTLSNNYETLPKCKFLVKTKKLFLSLREKEKTDQKDLQIIADAICDNLKVRRVRIIYSGVQNNTTVNGKLKSKTLGTYTPVLEIINIFRFTAIKKQEVATKTAFDVLLHELCHHFDYTILKLNQSIHSAGFYKRITFLKTSLME